MTDQETEATSRQDPQVRAGQAQGPSLLLLWPVRMGTVEDMVAHWPVKLKSTPRPNPGHRVACAPWDTPWNCILGSSPAPGARAL